MLEADSLFFIYLMGMRDNDLNGSGLRLVNTEEGVQLTINREASGSSPQMLSSV